VFDIKEVQYNIFEFKDTLADDFKNCAFFKFFAPSNNHSHVTEWVHYYIDFLYLTGIQNSEEVQL
jgi:hypothetical protein